MERKPDLTSSMDRPDNLGDVPAALRPGPSVSSQLPPDWVPADVVIRAFARRNARHGWETIVPEFSIAGMGNTFDAALENAIELLDDYFVLCARDGIGFAEARRPLPLNDMLRLLLEFKAGQVVGKLSFGNSGRKKLDLPLHNLTARAEH